KDERKPRCIPYLRVIDCFRVVDHLRDVFLHIRHYPFSWHLLSINARHATCFVEHLAASFRRAISSLVTALLTMASPWPRPRTPPPPKLNRLIPRGRDHLPFPDLRDCEANTFCTSD